ncbi:GATOR1 complex protein DEPDC5-like [Diadema antillarum]|uniref:GATOR1 complex protein DEPDC5-like n=1 Tax=Diadema antillarum TaxID=105358 RepID=UPI003A8A870B
MKNFKLWVHQKAFSEDELVINPKEFPDVQIGDILEIYHPDEDNSSHLLLQVKSFKDDMQQSSKEIVSVEQGVASLFQLRAYKAVKVQKVQPVDVALDLVELVFKDQYISRSDMWRLKNSMVNTCIHIQQKVELSGIRAQVQELWSRGERVSCGAITEDTRVAFRSATAMVYLFIQMSSEMWDFDTCGDLYWEKAVSGFLTDLFNKWRDKGVNNEVTVVLFSRTFFRANRLTEFPESVREHIKIDYAGRFFQDFYRVTAHHERREEWHGLLQTLKANFTTYLQEVMCHEHPDGPMPQGYNSTAAEGNFLETLNMTLNVFDKHFVDRNFERTGQLVVLLTPGAGVFEVDREMCKITRQRMIDYGIGSDLVCLAEQPLHAVPLFKFHNKTKEFNPVGVDYNIPHWLNYSFYTKDEGHEKSGKFKPRIKLAEKTVNPSKASEPLPSLVNGHLPVSARHALLRNISSDHSLLKSDDTDYQCEEYDERVFKMPSCKSPSPRTPASMRPSSAGRGSRLPASCGQAAGKKTEESQNQKLRGGLKESSKKQSSPGARQGSFHSDDGGAAIAIPGRGSKGSPFTRLQREANLYSQSFEGAKSKDSLYENQISMSPQGIVVGSTGAIHNVGNQTGQNPPSRALINPFGTSNMMVKLTSNRRRWTHTFPQGPTGATIQVHHRHQTPYHQSIPFHLPHQAQYHQSNHRTHRNSVTQGSSPSSPFHPNGGIIVVGPESAGGTGARTLSDSLERGAVPPGSGEQRLRPSASGSSLVSAGSSPSTDTVLQRPGSASTGEHGMRTFSDGVGSWDLRQHPWLRRSNNFIGVMGNWEWNPLTLTGVDWKSLTATACLPVTTDFYPDRLSLELDFVEFNYELLAEEDITGPFMTVEAIFQELISQRLLQGFQLVVLPSSLLAMISRSQRHPPLVTNAEKGEYVLSIGRIFHKLRLHSEKKTISVTRYRPRHPSLCDPIQYTYQLWSAQNEGYTPIVTTFRHEVIEGYNWNYLDNYISSHDSDFTLVDSLKFWRSRFLLIPNTPVLMKRFAEERGNVTFDPSSCEEDPAFRHFQIEAFLRFIEILNGIRRQTSTSRGPKVGTPSGRQTPSSGDLAHPANRSSPCQGSDTRQRHHSGARSNQGSPAPHPASHTHSEPMTLSLSTPLQVIATAMVDPEHGVRFLPPGQKGLPPNCFMAAEAVTWVQRSLSGEVSMSEALEVLKNMNESRLIQYASGEPHIPFVNGFYVYCLMLPENVPAMTDPTKPSHSWRDHIPLMAANSEFTSRWFEVAVMEESLWKQRGSEAGPSSGVGLMTPEGFHRQSPWSARERDGRWQGFGLGAGFSTTPNRAFRPPETRNVMLEIDCNKTDRVEWCHVSYDGTYRPDRVFDFQVEWLVCTPSLLNDMLQGWSRKANTFGFHLVPAPTDPFHQHPDFANPLRCPLFIPLAIQSLTPCHQEGGTKNLQPGDKCIDLFQDLILRKHGFILVGERRKSSFIGYGFHSGGKYNQAEYIHKSGVCFVTLLNNAEDPALAPGTPSSATGPSVPCGVVKVPRPSAGGGGMPVMVGRDGNFDIVDTAADEQGVEVREEQRRMRSGSIREVREKNREDGNPTPVSVGFLWSMNHMLTKRWRCSACGDEKFYDSLMRDLIAISCNVDGRLTELWQQHKDSLHP